VSARSPTSSATNGSGSPPLNCRVTRSVGSGPSRSRSPIVQSSCSAESGVRANSNTASPPTRSVVGAGSRPATSSLWSPSSGCTRNVRNVGSDGARGSVAAPVSASSVAPTPTTSKRLVSATRRGTPKRSSTDWSIRAATASRRARGSARGSARSPPGNSSMTWIDNRRADDGAWSIARVRLSSSAAVSSRGAATAAPATIASTIPVSNSTGHSARRAASTSARHPVPDAAARAGRARLTTCPRCGARPRSGGGAGAGPSRSGAPSPPQLRS
jgi:hypothetical protein